jgi:hypothetical protein
MRFACIAESAVIGPVELGIEASHRLLRMEFQADAETSA